jgi:hypothetical protein
MKVLYASILERLRVLFVGERHRLLTWIVFAAALHTLRVDLAELGQVSIATILFLAIMGMNVFVAVRDTLTPACKLT